MVMPRNWFIFAAVSALVASNATSATAALLNFQLTGSRSATFQLDSNPTPSSSSSSVFGNQIQFLNVPGTYNGVAGVASDIGFGTGGIFADLNITGTTLGFTQFGGPDLFSGSAKAPVFSPNVFPLTSIVSGNSTLTISRAAPAAVPEPATWAIVAGGVGLIGMLRQRRRRGSAVRGLV